MKKIFSLVLILLFASFSFGQELTFDNDIDPELLEFVDNLNDEDYHKEIEAINTTIKKFMAIDPDYSLIDFNYYLEKLTPVDTEEFLMLPTSEKIIIQNNNRKIEREMTQAVINALPSSKNNPNVMKQLELIKELTFHSNRLTEISEKIVKASGEYTGVVIELLTDTKAIIEDTKSKLSLVEAQVSLLNEALAWQEQKNKNAFIAGNIIIPAIGVTGLIPCIVMMANGDEKGYDFMITDLCVTFGCSLIWNSGHILFKWW